jgi:hypothetical protein
MSGSTQGEKKLKIPCKKTVSAGILVSRVKPIDTSSGKFHQTVDYAKSPNRS